MRPIQLLILRHEIFFMAQSWRKTLRRHDLRLLAMGAWRRARAMTSPLWQTLTPPPDASWPLYNPWPMPLGRLGRRKRPVLQCRGDRACRDAERRYGKCSSMSPQPQRDAWKFKPSSHARSRRKLIDQSLRHYFDLED
jgi:hypothetical protein